jgi:hypothetical protein
MITTGGPSSTVRTNSLAWPRTVVGKMMMPAAFSSRERRSASSSTSGSPCVSRTEMTRSDADSPPRTPREMLAASGSPRLGRTSETVRVATARFDGGTGGADLSLPGESSN